MLYFQPHIASAFHFVVGRAKTFGYNSFETRLKWQLHNSRPSHGLSKLKNPSSIYNKAWKAGSS